MKRSIIISIYLLLSCGFISKTESQTFSNQHTELIKNKVDAIFQKMIILAENLDYDELSKGVNDKYNAGFISNEKFYLEYASLIENIKNRAKGVTNQIITINKKQISVLSDTIVLLTATGISYVKLDDGRQLNINFYWSFIYEKIDNSWKVIHYHQSFTK
ncbi:SnoaL-like protein [Lutibacter oceani]|uniref:SnoaL-like protein n=1 Tax=Lutibacter oceani TaxID=1853311 RepID=A0A3D9RYF7_9FLAO|nr:nuclear transport factor 2 family protein [Lutibacter oceani]REE82871.1 SnoaL-like protein [Lutibacter oceani]